MRRCTHPQAGRTGDTEPNSSSSSVYPFRQWSTRTHMRALTCAHAHARPHMRARRYIPMHAPLHARTRTPTRTDPPPPALRRVSWRAGRQQRPHADMPPPPPPGRAGRQQRPHARLETRKGLVGRHPMVGFTSYTNKLQAVVLRMLTVAGRHSVGGHYRRGVERRLQPARSIVRDKRYGTRIALPW